MSRNLCKTGCDFCSDTPLLSEEPREITEQDCGPHMFPEYAGMKVANAECPSCCAKYLAWVTAPRSWGQWRLGERAFFDLSFRSTFNDEPGLDDLPLFDVTTRIVRERTGQFLPDAHGYGYLLKEKS